MALETPWHRAKKTRSQKQEESLGKRGQPQINSGRTAWTSKRDARIYNRLLVEARTTERGSVSISYSEWKDIRKQAQQTAPGLLPAMHIEIQDVQLLVLEDRDADAFFNYMEQLEEKVREHEGPNVERTEY